MELHPLDRELTVPDAHDRPIVVAAGSHFEAVGDGLGVDEERVETGSDDRVGEYRHRVVDDRPLSSINRLPGPSRECNPYRLVAETD